MLRSLKDFLETLVAGPAAADDADAEHRLRLATAVLLVEVMRADGRADEAQRKAALAALERRLALDADDGAALLALAVDTSRGANDFHAFTSTLNDRLDHAQKVRIVEAMWEVAYADGELAADERHVLWRVADLLHLPHAAYINAKLRARARVGA